MKKIFSIILFLLFVLATFAQQQKYLQINRCDGGFIQIPMSNIESIQCSQVDWTGEESSLCKSQITSTKDRTYITPLNKIENVLLNMPYKEYDKVFYDVIPMEEESGWDELMIASNNMCSIMRTNADGSITIVIDTICATDYSKIVIYNLTDDMRPLSILTEKGAYYFINHKENTADLLFVINGGIHFIQDVQLPQRHNNASQRRAGVSQNTYFEKLNFAYSIGMLTKGVIKAEIGAFSDAFTTGMSASAEWTPEQELAISMIGIVGGAIIGGGAIATGPIVIALAATGTVLAGAQYIEAKQNEAKKELYAGILGNCSIETLDPQKIDGKTYKIGVKLCNTASIPPIPEESKGKENEYGILLKKLPLSSSNLTLNLYEEDAISYFKAKPEEDGEYYVDLPVEFGYKYLYCGYIRAYCEEVDKQSNLISVLLQSHNSFVYYGDRKEFEIGHCVLNGYEQVSAEYSDGAIFFEADIDVEFDAERIDGTKEHGLTLYRNNVPVRNFKASNDKTKEVIRILFDAEKEHLNIDGNTFTAGTKGIWSLGTYNNAVLFDNDEFISESVDGKVSLDLIFDKAPIANTLQPIYKGTTTAMVECEFDEFMFWEGTCAIRYWKEGDVPQELTLDSQLNGKRKIELTDLEKGTQYHYQAIIKKGTDIIDEGEEVMFSTKDEIVKLTDFVQTGATYKKDAFEHEGVKYSYKYDVAVTYELLDDEDVVEWGYIYYDQNMEPKEIPLSGKASPYTDTRYSYYRNESPATVLLQPYVKFKTRSNYAKGTRRVGEIETNGYWYGEVQEFDLVYDQHTYAETLDATNVQNSSATVNCYYEDFAIVDGICGVEYWSNNNRLQETIEMNEDGDAEFELTGLQSNTTYYYRAFIKADDDYYWAEETKSFTTKQEQPQIHLCPDNNHPHLIDLGLPSGTKWTCCNVGANAPEEYGGYYDFGEISTAPTQSQMEELINNTVSQWTEFNGVNGRIFIGINGRTIFLPDAGYYWHDGTHWDQDGCYWSSTYIGHVEGVGPPLAIELRFGLNWNVFCATKGCHEGGYIQSVRPVQSGIQVTTGDATDINTTSVRLNGTVENLELATEDVILAFLYSPDEDILNSSDYKTIEVTNDSEGNLTTEISGLTDCTTYYYAAAYKLGDADYVLGEVKSFTTSVTVTTIENPEVTVISATLQGICSKGVSIAGFFVKKDGDTEYTQYDAYPDEEGNFSTTIDGLDIETQYVYYAFAQVNEQTYEGEEFSFTTKSLCPDNHHPHMIDLGLPSGTKWACCNVGANAPEEYGGYYAWGEIEEKKDYTIQTYVYWHDIDGDDLMDSNECTNIGSDIAGTSYDVATANWGAPWRMPSSEQGIELINSCKSEWITQNDVSGRIFIGPNGGTIFLPAAGSRRWDSGLLYAGSYGHYWSSSLYESFTTLAYCLGFNSGDVGCGNIGRNFGFSVRPVSK